MIEMINEITSSALGARQKFTIKKYDYSEFQ